MKKIPLFLLTLLACVICNVPATAVDADDLPTEKPSEMYRDLAEYWAPTIYQDVNETYLTRADIPTAFGNVKKCAVGKHPKSEKLGSTGQAACCARIHSRYFTGGSPSGLRV